MLSCLGSDTLPSVAPFVSLQGLAFGPSEAIRQGLERGSPLQTDIPCAFWTEVEPLETVDKDEEG